MLEIAASRPILHADRLDWHHAFKGTLFEFEEAFPVSRSALWKDTDGVSDAFLSILLALLDLVDNFQLFFVARGPRNKKAGKDHF